MTVALEVKPTPVIVTTVPAEPLVGLNPVIDSVGVKLAELAPGPAAVVTEIFAVTAPFGTVALICDGDTIENLAAKLPNLTMLAPLKYQPEIVTRLPVIPAVGVNELTVGAMCGVTV
jgi:hypothetical protein